MVRLEIRCPPPIGHPIRSGTFVVDVHGIRLSTTSLPSRRRTRFGSETSLSATEPNIPHHQAFILGVELRRFIVGCSPAGGNSVTCVLSSGCLDFPSEEQDMETSSHFGSNMPPLQPYVSVTKSELISGGNPSIMALSVELPSVHIDISKPTLDSLQYWADDMAQRIERIFNQNGGHDVVEVDKIDNAMSLIGSRFFARSRTGSSLSSNPEPSRSEMVFKITISEGMSP